MDVPNLILYSIQQLGVMLGTGAQTIILVAYLLAVRNGVVDAQEESFAKAVKRVLFIGLFLIVISGAAITVLELLAAHQPVVFSPAYLFKWCLILLAAVLARVTWGNSFPKGLLEGVAGGTWSALFAVHILAPVATWGQLLMLFAVWLIVFVLVWVGLVFALRGKRAAVAAAVVEEKNTQVLKPAIPIAPKPVPAPTAPVQKTPPPVYQAPAPSFAKVVPNIVSKIIPKAVPTIPFRPAIPGNLPVFTKDSPVVPLVAEKQPVSNEPPRPSIATQSGTPGLPGVRVMPKTLEELQQILSHI